jgi:hypothetical protein
VALAAHLEGLCRRAGLEVDIAAPPLGSVASLLRDRKQSYLATNVRQAKLLAGGEIDLLSVHRDADNQPVAKRHTEIAVAAAQAGFDVHVPVVPVRITEAWLLLDESHIRSVAGNPRGRVELGLPSVAEAERVADPKAVLREALAAASGCRGRRLKDLRARFSEHRRLLLERLDIDGPVSRATSWQALLESISTAIGALDT